MLGKKKYNINNRKVIMSEIDIQTLTIFGVAVGSIIGISLIVLLARYQRGKKIEAMKRDQIKKAIDKAIGK